MSAASTVVVIITLPESLAREAEANGLLSPAEIEHLLRDALRKRRIEGLFAAADRLAALQLPPLTEAEVEAEIAAVRTHRRSHDAHGG